jgi:hypothetical protein
MISSKLKKFLTHTTTIFKTIMVLNILNTSPLLHCLQVGGIKEKVLAAHRAGVSHVILPRRNEKDLKELPRGVKVSKLANVLTISYTRRVER